MLKGIALIFSEWILSEFSLFFFFFQIKNKKTTLNCIKTKMFQLSRNYLTSQIFQNETKFQNPKKF